MLYTDYLYQIKTYEEKIRQALETAELYKNIMAQIEEMKGRVKQSSTSSTKTRVKVVYKEKKPIFHVIIVNVCLLYTSPSPRDRG